MEKSIIGSLIGGVGCFAKSMQSRPVNTHDKLAEAILVSQSAHIVGYFLDTERCDDIEFQYREAAMAAAVRLINDTETDNSDKNYLQVLIDDIAEAKDDDLQQDAKELLLSYADDKELSEIALNEDEETEMRVNAVEKMSDMDMLLDIASDAGDDDVRQAAKKRIRELR